MFKWIMKFLLVVAICFVAFLFIDDEEEIPEFIDSDETWSVLVYLCGSDLESDGGLASDDLDEIMSVTFPSNVNVIIQTGGSMEWQNYFVSDERMQRYVCSGSDIELVDELPLYNMGDGETLRDFLEYSKVNYPSDHTAVIIWDHGGGSVGGVAYDELYSDSLDLNELEYAFSSVYGFDSENPPVDIIGFDACLMATIDVASSFKDIARYMVASEDLEPGYGWNYSEFLKKLAYNPSIDPKDLGIAICDSYFAFYEDWGMEDEITLSLVDLTKLEPLLDAYEDFGNEAFIYAKEDPNFLVKFARNASKAENYGGNNRYDGYTNMVDLGDLALNNHDYLENSTSDVLETLDDCVIYQVKGDYRANASGLSCYYSFNGDWDDFMNYKEIACSSSFKNYYSYSLGNLDYVDEDYVDDLGFDIFDLDFPFDLSEIAEEDYQVYLNSDNCAVLDVGSEVAEGIAEVYYSIAYFSEEDDVYVSLGSDDIDLDFDWDNGVFTEHFDNTWGAIDGHLIYMEPIGYGEDYYEFTSPILLNGEECQLHLAYNFNEDAFKILGASEGINEYGMASKDLRKLAKGDKITTLFYASTMSIFDWIELEEFETFTVGKNPTFDYVSLGDGEFILSFEIRDYQQEVYYPWTTVYFYVEDYEIYPELMY